MRIVHLINNLEREGAQTVVFNLVTAPAGGSTEHCVCVRRPGGPLQAALEERGVCVFTPPRYYNAFAVRRSLRFLEGVLRRHAFDLIHAHMADAAFLGWLAGVRCALPLVITHHGYGILPDCGLACRMAYWCFLAAASRYAARNVAVSATVADRLRRKIHLPGQRVEVIPNGVPVPVEGDLVRRHRPGSPEIRIVTVGRLVKLKGHDELIAAAGVVVERYPAARFYIVGDGPLRQHLEQTVAAHHLCGKIVFTGRVADVAAYLREADVYVSTSHYEGMPVAMLEAMAWGVPVVASAVPGNRDVLTHEETGLMYASGDVDGLARAIGRVIETPASARHRSRLARQLVRDRYSVDAAINAYEQLYREVAPSARSS